MARKNYKTRGIVLKGINYSEADKIFTIYSEGFGKVVVLAKGVRRLTSKKRGNIEVFNHIIFFAQESQNLEIVTEVETIETFPLIKRDFAKIGAAYQICEIVDKITPEKTPQKEIYELLVLNLRQIEKEPFSNLSFIVKCFSEQIIKILGFWPSEKPFPEKFNVFFFIEEIIEKRLKSKNIFK